ncbi:phosphoenolpyruvate--protein phosphotransferase [candidate division BRC1 bacterium HGW-BRC1-1]|jgi:phosphotransferase system enzyme I (PtsI)|nr:MAG: phosphoenolpyruvate--protein phosphotransferase [candidate division BRC1 bacterium HGW-BRC1-1]
MTIRERIFDGIAVSAGYAVGRSHVANRDAGLKAEAHPLHPDEVDGEISRFLEAVTQARDQLMRIHRQVAETLDAKHAEIYLAQSMMLDDADLLDATISDIRTELLNSEFLFARRLNLHIELMQQFDDEILKARDSDIMDVGNRVLRNLLNPHADGRCVTLEAWCVLVAHDLPPSEATPLLKEKAIGLVLEKGGPTSHTAIMAKALEIPAVVGVPDITKFIEEGAITIVDGVFGRVVINPTAETLLAYEEKQRDYLTYERGLETLRDVPGETIDGYSVKLRSNIELPEEIAHIEGHGAKGVGLFRTEFLFLNRSEPPSEDEQFRIYRQVVEGVKPDSAVVRTIDIGGDKFFSHMGLPTELNPFMGQRAIRLCLQHTDIFRTQLRAMLRASAYGRLRILIPMISGIEEFLEVKRHLKAVKQELRANHQPFDAHIELGAMIEVPSAAVVADMLAREADFFSIGTNDLIQYSLAVDRGNEKVAYLYEPLHPAILRLLRTIINAGHDAGIPVSVCGEMAGDPMMAVILVGMGIDELSMSSMSVPSVKKLIRSIQLSEAKLLVEDIMGQNTIDGVKKLVWRRLRRYVKQNKLHVSHLSHANDMPSPASAA